VQFISAHIEFLWIIPVFAFGFFLFMIQMMAQKKEDRHDLSKEVARFNTGVPERAKQDLQQGADRLAQLEQAISVVTDSLSVQQRTIEQFHRDSSGQSGEINELKSRLRDLYKEYDIILSENYSLRARVKKLQDRSDIRASDQEPPLPPLPDSSSAAAKVDMRLYEDTRTLSSSLLDDTSEIDLSDLTDRTDMR